ncbi:LOW QUALITY PROTEIN: protein FAM124B [Meriones unguiculatus]|uniref:LOW QUALITY PROTEIN: protein FAM124B n=1 Tax=Meriones unguiculatus TaxID=10047 RepID=UPI000B4F9A98|nr:LOW QUALITY PROTEIN: protein FAM124B [Meriones unguiculatus]
MDETREPLALTVHLLADTGNGSLLQQALDQLLDCICPEVRLFLVSERARPVSYHEKYHPRRVRFPGMSVLLFLQESLGQERLFRVLDFLQHSPWQGFPTQHAQGRPCPYLPANQEFYSLHNQMPVWGVRPVHCGSDILRVTLYCSFDNFEDAIRLYEMLLQRDATVQKSNFCFFVLYATEGFSLQLSLKQLPLGMSVDPKESSVLQFRVQEIGQLVPLLPNPCVPISSTRWQTQDYDGNKILLQVQPKPGLGVRNGECPFLSGSLRGDKHRQGSRLNSVSTQRTLEPRSRRNRDRRFKVHSLELPQPSGTSENSSDPLWRSPGWSSLAHSSATGTRQHRLSIPVEPEVRRMGLKDSSSEKFEAETNVDTGFTVVSSEPRRSFPSRFPRDPQSSQPARSLEVTTSPNQRALKDRLCPLPGQRDFGAKKLISRCFHHLPVQGEEKEEFFI